MPQGIVAENLTRTFRIRTTDEGQTSTRELTAVNNLDLAIEPGELFGLLGRNGAGKTTTIRMLSTLIEPTSGRASVAGFDVVRESTSVRASIGCLLPGERNHYWKLTARENLRFFAAMYRVDARREKSRIEQVLETVSLSARADERVENYSSGMRQRLSLARALLHDPPVLVLDEPTSGLDVHSARSLRSLVRNLASTGRTILLTTHNLQEAQEMCSRVGIIHRGRLVALDTPEGLRNLSGAMDIVEIRCRLATPSAEGLTGPLPPMRASLEGAQVAMTANAEGSGDGDWVATVKGRKASALIPRLAAALLDAGWELTACSVKRPDLEDVFVEMTADEEVAPDE